MANQHEDRVFLKRFSMVILVLVIITVAIIVIANLEGPESDEDANPSRVKIADERTRPVGAVRTELPEAPPAAEPVTPIPDLAEVGEPTALDGAAIYAQVCQACHMTGAAGAPVPGTEGWAERADKGLDVLAANAINGIGIMPPKGGRADLSDADVTAAVEHMLDQQ